MRRQVHFRIILVFIFIVLFFAGDTFATSLSRDEAIKLFSHANETYLSAKRLIAEGKLTEADKKLTETAMQYEKILLNSFIHGAIYYNLGNTYYRKGNLGKAILNYRKAQRFMPRSADLSANLRLAKNSVEDEEISHETPVVIKRIFFWVFLLSMNELALISVFLYVVLMSLFILLIIFKSPWLKRLITGFSAALFVAVASLCFKMYDEGRHQQGVVIVEECKVRYGPGSEYEPKFIVHDGAECEVEQEKGEWYKVYLYVKVEQTGTGKKPNRELREGWLHKEDIGTI